jgi:Flp pilus assembly protein TadB
MDQPTNAPPDFHAMRRLYRRAAHYSAAAAACSLIAGVLVLTGARLQISGALILAATVLLIHSFRLSSRARRLVERHSQR